MQSDSTNVSPAPDAFFSSTLQYIQFQKQKGGVMGEKYAPIKCGVERKNDEESRRVSIVYEKCP
ncbi:unnamed protein product [Prunus armeniaca]|uniref:Uncharacterized protein n=1 Tax=Prunus armeniaca TaxID=36596 RepID=A0A6J5TN83_PRUAR|nr:unnamed protein product [Prunus armeniaca]CAB4296138.1 unnamed protein product [Prunus armeniaca]